jgi:isoleucyl-tRNA synthetase
MYFRLRLPDMPESVHLFNWPEADKNRIDKELEEKMSEVRNVVSQVLAQRAEAGIKVRQPIASLKIKNQKSKIKNNKELLELIKEEVNVKEIVFGSEIRREVELDTEITPELKEEGALREVIHRVQMMRKKAGLKSGDKVSILYRGGPWLNKILAAKKDFILKELMAEDFEPKKGEDFDAEKEVKIGGENLWLSLKKV